MYGLILALRTLVLQHKEQGFVISIYVKNGNKIQFVTRTSTLFLAHKVFCVNLIIFTCSILNVHGYFLLTMK